MKRWIAPTVVLGLAVAAVEVDAQVFRGTVTDLTGVTGTFTFRLRNAEDAIDQIRTENLQRVLPGYTDFDAINADFNYRGVPMSARFDAAATVPSTVLHFSIPDLGFARDFIGATRSDSVRLLLDFLKQDSAFLGQLGRLLVAKSPADPIAGNPASLQSSMIMGDFATALWAMNPDLDEEDEQSAWRRAPLRLAQAGSAAPAAGAVRTVNNLAGAGVSGLSISQEDIRANAATLPLQYNSRSDVDPRRGFSIRVPISTVDYEGSKGVGAGLAFAYRLPLARRWAITPSIGYGATYSEDLGAVGHFVSASVTSTYAFKFTGFDLVLGNMIGVYRSLKFTGGDYSYDPEITNVAFRNGLVYSRPFELGGTRRSLQAYVIDTRMTGTELFIDNWQEIGINIGSRSRINAAREYGSVGIGYLFSPSYKGFTVQASYLF
jgi:hypothetical protein